MVSDPFKGFSTLAAKGFQIEFHSHASAILSVDFPDALVELETALVGLTIPIEEIIAGGGGEAKGTQRLRKALAAAGWVKTKFEIKKIINGRESESISHEIDHVREFRSESLLLKSNGTTKTPSSTGTLRILRDCTRMAPYRPASS